MGPLKIYKDSVTKSAHYASRNFHDIVIDQNLNSNTSSELDFRFSLRQERLKPSGVRSPNGHPEFSENRARKRDLNAGTSSQKDGFEQLRLGNLATVEHLVVNRLRFVPLASLRWELNLRS